MKKTTVRSIDPNRHRYLPITFPNISVEGAQRVKSAQTAKSWWIQISLQVWPNVFSPWLGIQPNINLSLTGDLVERHWPEGAFNTPQTNSQTNECGETGEAVFEGSRRDGFFTKNNVMRSIWVSFFLRNGYISRKSTISLEPSQKKAISKTKKKTKKEKTIEIPWWVQVTFFLSLEGE